MENDQDKKTYSNNRINQKAPNLNFQYFQRKYKNLQQFHQNKKKAEQSPQFQLKKPSKGTNQHAESICSSSIGLSNVSHNIVGFQQRNEVNSYNMQTQIQCQISDKRVSAEDILKDGKILKILQKTLNHDEYRVQSLYQGQVIELIATKEQILKNNIIPLLDFYEKVLGLR